MLERDQSIVAAIPCCSLYSIQCMIVRFIFLMWTCGNDQPVSVWLRLRLETVAAGRVLELHLAQIYPILGRPDERNRVRSIARSLARSPIRSPFDSAVVSFRLCDGRVVCNIDESCFAALDKASLFVLSF